MKSWEGPLYRRKGQSWAMYWTVCLCAPQSQDTAGDIFQMCLINLHLPWWVLILLWATYFFLGRSIPGTDVCGFTMSELRPIIFLHTPPKSSILPHVYTFKSFYSIVPYWISGLQASLRDFIQGVVNWKVCWTKVQPSTVACSHMISGSVILLIIESQGVGIKFKTPHQFSCHMFFCIRLKQYSEVV